MAKFNWQNGTLVTPARVNIGGNIYDVTPEQYSGQTPLSAENLNTMQDNLIDLIWPVGSYYETSDTSFNPNTAWGGTWVEDTKGLVTVAQDEDDLDFNTVGSTYGSKYLQEHNHEATSYNIAGSASRTVSSGSDFYTTSGNIGEIKIGNSGTGNCGNVQPSIVVKRWHRTA